MLTRFQGTNPAVTRALSIAIICCMTDASRDVFAFPVSWFAPRSIPTAGRPAFPAHAVLFATVQSMATSVVGPDQSNASPACGLEEIRRSTDYITVTPRYSNQKGFGIATKSSLGITNLKTSETTNYPRRDTAKPLGC